MQITRTQNAVLVILTLALTSLFSRVSIAESNGLAPEVIDLNAEDISLALEAKIPDLKKPFIDATPTNRNDGIPVGKLGLDGGNKAKVLQFSKEIAEGKHGMIDSFLIFKDGKLLLESYYRRGRINYPHYQMSITKSYTAMAVGRAIQLGYLSMDDLDKPVASFLKDLKPEQFVKGAAAITLAEAMNMKSGIRISKNKATQLRQKPNQLKGQGQIQAYFDNSSPIPDSPRTFKYQSSDPSMTMQVVNAVVPGGARKFIESELLGKMGITVFAWMDDLSNLPKSAAGSSMRSRDMIKWGMLILNNGKWNGQQLVPAKFVKSATSKIHTNRRNTSYGYFWWRHDMEFDKKKFDCISGRGAGGQFILIFPEQKLITVITSHNKGMGSILKTFPTQLLPHLIN